MADNELPSLDLPDFDMEKIADKVQKAASIGGLLGTPVMGPMSVALGYINQGERDKALGYHKPSIPGRAARSLIPSFMQRDVLGILGQLGPYQQALYDDAPLAQRQQGAKQTQYMHMYTPEERELMSESELGWDYDIADPDPATSVADVEGVAGVTMDSNEHYHDDPLDEAAEEAAEADEEMGFGEDSGWARGGLVDEDMWNGVGSMMNRRMLELANGGPIDNGPHQYEMFDEGGEEPVASSKIPAIIAPDFLPDDKGKKFKGKGEMFRGLGSLMKSPIMRIAQAVQMGYELLPEDMQVVDNFVDYMKSTTTPELFGSGIEAFKNLIGMGSQDSKGIMSLPDYTKPAPAYYSSLSRAVEALPMEKGNASQMRSMLAKSTGVKPEEMKWTGLDDFFKERGKGSVTKEELIDFMAANQVGIQEVQLNANRPSSPADLFVGDEPELIGDVGDVRGGISEYRLSVSQRDGTPVGHVKIIERLVYPVPGVSETNYDPGTRIPYASVQDVHDAVKLHLDNDERFWNKAWSRSTGLKPEIKALLGNFLEDPKRYEIDLRRLLKDYDYDFPTITRGLGSFDIRNDDGVLVATARDLADAQHQARIFFEVTYPGRLPETEGGDTRWSNPGLNLPGGENYREFLLMFPEDFGGRPTVEYQFRSHQDPLSLKSFSTREEALRAAGGDPRLVKEKWTEPPIYRSSHYPDFPNLFAHARLDDRTGPSGEKILFVQEAQGDMHQTARSLRDAEITKIASVRRKGLSMKELEKMKKEVAHLVPEDFGYKIRLPRLDKDAAKRLARYKSLRSTYEAKELWGADPRLRFWGNIGLTEEYTALEKEFGKYDATLFGGRDAVPDAPLKKNWHELLLRRVLRIAAEEGYDGVAWTPGKMQTNRYPGMPEDHKEGLENRYDKIYRKYLDKFGKKFGAKVKTIKINAGDLTRIRLGQSDPSQGFTKGTPVKEEVWWIPVTRKMKENLIRKGIPKMSAGGFVDKPLYDQPRMIG